MKPLETPTRNDRRRTRTRAALLDAAEAAFATDGYVARIDRIAQDADVSIGSIYQHFGSKQGLWSALAERALGRFDAYLQQAYRPEWGPLEQVVACGDAYLRFHAEHPGSFRFLAFDGTQARVPLDDDDLVARTTARLGSIIAGFEAKIAEAMDAGEATPGDARLAARFLWAAWNGAVALTVRSDGLRLSEDELEACLQQARMIVLEGLSAPGYRDADGRSLGRLRSVESPPEEQA